ncbi:MAG: hypothetical protein ACPW61_00355 [Methyloligella sp. ZOD6]
MKAAEESIISGDGAGEFRYAGDEFEIASEQGITMQGNRKWSVRAALAAAALGATGLLAPIAAQAGAVHAGAVAGQQAAMQNGLLQQVIFHHRKRPTELYCVEGDHWWYYRPYQTAGENYARCMPYFHYPAERAGAYGPPPDGMK